MKSVGRSMKRRILAVLITSILVICLAPGCHSSSKSKSSQPSSATTQTTKSAGQQRPKWMTPEREWADSFAEPAYPAMTVPMLSLDGQSGWFYGTVGSVNFASESNGRPTFINFTQNGERCEPTGVIWGDSRGNFPDGLLDSLAGKTVAIYGQAYLYTSKTSYKPVLQVELTDPSQIRVYPG